MKKIYVLLMIIMSISLAGCSSEKVEDKEINEKDESNKVVNDEPSNVVNVEETYPQSVEYFKAIDALEKIDNKEESSILLEELQGYILENYPYDYSQAKDQAMLSTVEDFGIMERFLITNYDHMFYEATNNISTIGLNYYVKSENDLRTNSISITTKDFNLQKEICENDNKELKIHGVYEKLVEDVVKESNINIEKVTKELEKISTDNEKKEMDEDVVVYSYFTNEENLMITYSKKDSKITNLGYRNIESFYYETVYSKDGEVELRIMINDLKNVYDQKALFDKVIIGCSTKDITDNEGDYDKVGVRGEVTEIIIDKDEASITVEGKLESDTMYDKAVVIITKDTLIQTDSMSRLFQISDIQKGMTVEVMFKGGVKEIYPVQGSADILRIITTDNTNN